jgi:hypothetical protein
MATTMAVSVVGFKQWTLTPNQPPFLLARSLVDGPARLYLQAHCPQINRVMCHHLDHLDLSVDDFIWHDIGVYSTVSLDEAAQIRAEEKSIVFAATLEHPWMQAVAMLRNWGEQLSFFTLKDFYIPSHGIVARRGDIPATPEKNVPAYAYGDANTADLVITPDLPPAEPGWKIALTVPEYLIVLVGLGSALMLASDRREWDFLIFILSAVVINALAVTLSEVAARYQARVIWLIPMTALLFLARRVGPPSELLHRRREAARSRPTG